MSDCQRRKGENEMDIEIKQEFYQLARDGMSYEKIPHMYQSKVSLSSEDILSPSHCRLCAIQNADLIDIFANHTTGVNIAEKIKFCLRIVVNESDNFPKRICSPCSEELELCYQFNRIVEEADRRFCAFNKPRSRKLKETQIDLQTLSCDSQCEALFDHDIDSTDSISAITEEEVSTTGSSVQSIPVETSLESSSGVLDPNATLCVNNLITVHEKIPSITEYQKVNSSTSDSNDLRTSGLDIVQQTICASKVSSTSCSKSQPEKQTPSAQYTRGSEDQKDPVVSCGTDEKKRSEGIETEAQMGTTKKVGCEACGRPFIASLDLSLHLRELKKKTDYVCSMCNKSFKHLSTMKLHMTVHSDDRPWQCDYCKKSFKIKGVLRQHLAVCKNRPKSRDKIHKCKSHATVFSTGADLTGRKRLYKDSRLHSCPYCKKSFKTNGHLEDHLIVCKKRTEAKGSHKYIACAVQFTPVYTLNRQLLQSNMKSHQ